MDLHNNQRNPRVTTDAIIIKDNRIMLVLRKYEPFKGKWALPGGHVEYGEMVEAAVAREAEEETGLKVEPVRLVGVYSDPNRDPRGHAIGLAYICEITGGSLKAGDDAVDAKWWPLDALPELAFDHSKMVQDAKKMLK